MLALDGTCEIRDERLALRGPLMFSPGSHVSFLGCDLEMSMSLGDAFVAGAGAHVAFAHCWVKGILAEWLIAHRGEWMDLGGNTLVGKEVVHV